MDAQRRRRALLSTAGAQLRQARRQAEEDLATYCASLVDAVERRREALNVLIGQIYRDRVDSIGGRWSRDWELAGNVGDGTRNFRKNGFIAKGFLVIVMEADPCLLMSNTEQYWGDVRGAVTAWLRGQWQGPRPVYLVGGVWAAGWAKSGYVGKLNF